MREIADIRKDYRMRALNESDCLPNPIDQFELWWQHALESNLDEVNAMTLATANLQGKPAARTVLLKGYDEKGFVFFSNYESNKAEEMLANPQADLVFFWKELERQVRISGSVEKIAAVESDVYFASRPEGSQLGAWASPQSRVIPNRELIEQNVIRLTEAYQQKTIQRPPHWGGYRVIPDEMEFWQGRPSRLHDRILYQRNEEGWKMCRLAP